MQVSARFFHELLQIYPILAVLQKMYYNLYTQCVRLFHGHYLYDSLTFCCGTSILMDNIHKWENIKAFIIILRWLNFIWCATLDNAFNFWEILWQGILKWSSKESLAVIYIPYSSWPELLEIFSDLIFSVVFFRIAC